MYGMTVLTTVVAMEPETWDHQVFPVALDVVEAQLRTVLDGIGFDAMKTGMLGSVDIIELVAKHVRRSGLPQIVIDPVMVCKGTDEVLQPENTEAMIEFCCQVLTWLLQTCLKLPNWRRADRSVPRNRWKQQLL